MSRPKHGYSDSLTSPLLQLFIRKVDNDVTIENATIQNSSLRIRLSNFMLFNPEITSFCRISTYIVRLLILSFVWYFRKGTNIQYIGPIEAKLLFILHWIIQNAPDECVKTDCEKGTLQTLPHYYLFNIPTMTVSIQDDKIGIIVGYIARTQCVSFKFLRRNISAGWTKIETFFFFLRCYRNSHFERNIEILTSAAHARAIKFIFSSIETPIPNSRLLNFLENN